MVQHTFWFINLFFRITALRSLIPGFLQLLRLFDNPERDGLAYRRHFLRSVTLMAASPGWES